jgi:ribosomal subunit interface protein
VKTPVQITYRHLTPSEFLTGVITEEVAKLEEFSESIEDCRVIVDEPNQNHRRKQFRVEIIARVAGAELVAGRDPSEVEDGNAYQLVHDSFKAIRRQLIEHTQRRRHEVKGHSR